MEGFKSMVVVMIFTVLASFQLQSTLAQTRHVVGGSLGWNVPPNTTAYTSWAESQTSFTVGDTLFFNFTTGFHDVREVSQAAYGPCTVANPLLTVSDGPATINLTTTGNHYYICAFGTHCQGGQKVMVNVLAASGNSTPPAATSPPPSGSTPSTPPATTSPPPPPPSSASTLTAVVPVAFFLAALALVF